MSRFKQRHSFSYLPRTSLSLEFRILSPKILMLLCGTVGIFTSCEAVQWEGIKISVETPEKLPVNDTIGIHSTVNQDRPSLTGRTFLYLGSKEGDEGSLIPIVEILPNGFLSTPSNSYKERSGEFAKHYFELGSQFSLFSDGHKIGTLTTTHNQLNLNYCHPRPEAKGIVQLAPGVDEAESFLALAKEFSTNNDVQDYRPVIQTRALRQASIDMIIDVIPSVGATWPSSVLESRQALNFFRLREDQAPTIIATFTKNGALEISPASEGMYSILLIGSNSDGMAYKPTYVDYRPAVAEGKAAGRYFDHLDLNGDGMPEIILEVMGETSKWISVLGNTGNTWNRMYIDSCGPFDTLQNDIS